MLKSISTCPTLIMLFALTVPATPAFADSDAAVPVPNRRDFATVLRGAKLFQQYCTACHGKRAEGPPSGWVPMANSTSIPPALNGSAHAWHHPTRDLIQTMTLGTLARGGSMPPWGGVLDTQQMVDVISWLQSKWPEQRFQEWKLRDAQTQ